MPRGRIPTHGHTIGPRGYRSLTYRAWQALKARCLRPTQRQFERYGPLWYEPWRSFETFLADMGERPQGTTLDRIDTTKPYSPANCRWATPTQQARNRLNNKLDIEAARLIRASIGIDRVIAEQFNISPTLVRKIRAGKIWKEDQ
jgi:hypothetical protein